MQGLQYQGPLRAIVQGLRTGKHLESEIGKLALKLQRGKTVGSLGTRPAPAARATATATAPALALRGPALEALLAPGKCVPLCKSWSASCAVRLFTLADTDDALEGRSTVVRLLQPLIAPPWCPGSLVSRSLRTKSTTGQRPSSYIRKGSGIDCAAKSRTTGLRWLSVASCT